MYYIMAVLVQLNGTTRIRFALLLVVLWTTWLVMPLEQPGDATQLQINTALSVSRGSVNRMAHVPYFSFQVHDDPCHAFRCVGFC